MIARVLNPDSVDLEINLESICDALFIRFKPERSALQGKYLRYVTIAKTSVTVAGYPELRVSQIRCEMTPCVGLKKTHLANLKS